MIHFQELLALRYDGLVSKDEERVRSKQLCRSQEAWRAAFEFQIAPADMVTLLVNRRSIGCVGGSADTSRSHAYWLLWMPRTSCAKTERRRIGGPCVRRLHTDSTPLFYSIVRSTLELCLPRSISRADRRSAITDGEPWRMRNWGVSSFTRLRDKACFSGYLVYTLTPSEMHSQGVVRGFFYFWLTWSEIYAIAMRHMVAPQRSGPRK